MAERKTYSQVNSDDVIDLGQLFWNILQGCIRFWWLIVALAGIGIAAFCLKSRLLYTPMYQSQATFTVLTEGTTGNGAQSGTYNFNYETSTAGQMGQIFSYLIDSQILTDAMEEDLGVEELNGTISVQTVSNSNLITLTAESESPEDAKGILESALKVFPDTARFVIGDSQFYMVEKPNTPSTPYNRPDYLAQVKKGGVYGAAAGFLLICLYAYFKKTVQKPEELKQVMSLTCMASVPQVQRKLRKKENQNWIRMADKETLQVFRENIQSLQIRISRELEEKGGKVLLVTSTVPEEGKSTLAYNLAVAAASHGIRVLFVDADLRKQDDWKQITQEAGRGLVSVLAGKSSLSEAVRTEPDTRIDFLGGSRPVKKVQQVLNHPQFGELVEEMKQNWDLILLDAPPTELFEDAGVLAEHADGILYVVGYDRVTRNKILDGLSSLESGNAVFLGYVFNGVPVHRGGYGYYGYGRYGYGYYGQGSYGCEDGRGKKSRDREQEADL